MDFTNIPYKKVVSGKVREVYDISENGKEELVIVTTDRISAYDVILKSTIPGKGIALNKISNFWFGLTGEVIKNHLIATDTKDMPAEFSGEYFKNRTIKVKKLKMLPYEVIVRGYLFGSMWNAYKNGEEFCGMKITGEHQLAEKLAEPIVTPSFKNSEGHDINITVAEMAEGIGSELTEKICSTALALFEKCCDYAQSKGIIIADTKFEFGIDNEGNLTLADEIFTPDSSRFWSATDYRTGVSPKSYDKQFTRDWLTANKLNGVTPAPELPEEVINKTAALYSECCEKLTGEKSL